MTLFHPSPFRDGRARGSRRGAAFLAAWWLAAAGAAAQQGAGGWEADGRVSLKFPNNSVSDILAIYQRLSGKVVIKDSQIFDGESISLVTDTDVTVEEALRLMEGALQVNGYVLIESEDGKSVRAMVHDADQARLSEGMQLVRRAEELPAGDALAGYFMPLDYLDPTEAASILSNHVGLNSFGRLTPVANPPGLMITESGSMIRQLDKMRELLDVPHAEGERMTRFFELVHAEATIVAQIIQATLEEKEPAPPVGRNTLTDGSPREAARSDPEPPPQVVADDRLNRIMVVARPADFTYIASLIEEFDQPIPSEEVLERRLHYVFVDEMLPVLADVLQDTGTGQTTLPGGGTLTTRERPEASVQASALTGKTRSSVQTRDVSATDPGGRQDQLLEPLESTAPISVQVGKTRIIADLQSNAIIAQGPRDSLRKIEEMIERMDRKPPQVYLATIIGQLELEDGMELGVDWLQQFEETGDGGYAGSLLNRPALLDAVTDMRSNVITSAVGPLSGLNFYGQLGDSVEVFIHALEKTDRFKILSRPAVYAANNKKAVIASGQEIPVPTSSVTDLSETDNVLTNIEFRDVVLKLEVIPLINENKEVTLTIAQVSDTVVGSTEVGGDEVPIIGTDRLTTTVTIPNRHTVVLGGLITETEEEKSQGLPIISRLPVLGHAFKTSGVKKVRKELLIFIQPVVVEDSRELAEASFQEDIRTAVGVDAYQRFPDHPAVWVPPSAEGEAEEPDRRAKSEERPPEGFQASPPAAGRGPEEEQLERRQRSRRAVRGGQR